MSGIHAEHKHCLKSSQDCLAWAYAKLTNKKGFIDRHSVQLRECRGLVLGHPGPNSVLACVRAGRHTKFYWSTVRIGSRLLGHGRRSLSSWLLRQSVCRRASCSNAALAATCRRLVAMIIYNWICLLYLQYKTITGLNYNSVNHNTNHSLALWGTVPVLHKPSKLLTAVNPTQVIGGKASQSTKGIPGVNTWGKHRVNRQYNERLDVRRTANRSHGHNIHAVEQTVNDSVFVVRLCTGLCQSLDDVSCLLQRLPLLIKFMQCQLYNCIALVVVIIFWHYLFGVYNKALMIISAKSKVKIWLYRVVVVI